MPSISKLVEKRFSPLNSSEESNTADEDSSQAISKQLVFAVENCILDAGLKEIPANTALFLSFSQDMQAEGKQSIPDLTESLSSALSIMPCQDSLMAISEAFSWLERRECEYALITACDLINGVFSSISILIAEHTESQDAGLHIYADIERLNPDLKSESAPKLLRAGLLSVSSPDWLESENAHYFFNLKKNAEKNRTESPEQRFDRVSYLNALALEIADGSQELQAPLAILSSALALDLRIVPGSNFQIENHFADLLLTPSKARPWIHAVWPLEAKQARTAYLETISSAFLLSEYGCDIDKPQKRHLQKQSSELFLFSAETPEQLLELLKDFHSHCSSDETSTLCELACDNNCSSKNDGRFKLSVIASNTEELCAFLEEAIFNLAGDSQKPILPAPAKVHGVYYKGKVSRKEGKLVFVLPGLGASYPHMLEDLCFYFPELRQVFDFVERLAIRSEDKIMPSRAVFPLRDSTGMSPATLASMDSAVVTLLLAEWAIFALLKKLGIEADVFLGCSTGEFAAISMSEAVDILKAAETFYKLSTQVSRSISIQELKDLRSIRISARFDREIRPLFEELGKKVYLGADLSESCVLVSGNKDAIEELCGKLNRNNIEYLVLPMAVPYHTALVSGKISAEDEAVAALPMQAPRVESWSCSTGTEYPKDETSLRRISTELFEKPIQLRRTVEQLHDNGARIFLEVGPKGALSPYISETLKGKEHLSLAANLMTRTGIDQLNLVLAQLALAGIRMDLSPLYERRVSRIARTFKGEHENLILDLLQAAYDPLLSDYGMLSDEVLISYLSGMQDLHASAMESQERMMLAYLEAQADDQYLDADLCDYSCQRLLPFLRDAELKYGPESYWLEFKLNTRDQVFLLDHAIGKITSSLEQNSKVCLLPLMASLEIMAEGASLFFSSESVPTRISDVRAYKRIRVEEADLPLRLEMRKLDNNRIETRICACDLDEDDSNLLVSCIMEFSNSYPPAPDPASFSRQEVRASVLPPEQIYSPAYMFHGKSMQAVVSIDSVGKRSIEGQIECRSQSDWFASEKNAGMLIQPLWLDNASQFVLYQMFEHSLPVSALLPFHIESVEFFQPFADATGKIATARAFLRSMSLRGTEAQVELLSPQGQVMFRVNEISSRAIVLPPAFKQLLANPEIVLCKSLEISTASPAQISFLESREMPEDETALDWLTDYLLSTEEQWQWRRVGRAEKRRRDWLSGRIAAKDAVRRLVKAELALELNYTDIEISASRSSPLPQVLIRSGQVPWTPQVSISHCTSMTVALAEKPQNRFSGIDVENIVEREDGFEDLAFSKKEQNWIHEQGASEAQLRLTLLWTAKEAAGKASGLGLRGNPKSFELSFYDDSSSTIGLVRAENGAEGGLYKCLVQGLPDKQVCLALVTEHRKA